MSNFSDYQSGGRGFTSPNQAIESATYREFMEHAGGINGVASKDQAEIANIIQSMLERMASEAKVANSELSEMVSAVRDAVMNAPNQQQGAREGMGQLNKLIQTNLSLMGALQSQKGLTSNERSVLGNINNKPLLQLINVNQNILGTLTQIQNKISGLGTTIIDLNTEDDRGRSSDQQELLDTFEGLKQTLIHSLINSPTATKLNQLGASAMTLWLMKGVGNEKLHPALRKTAAAAIYLQVPQTIANAISLVLSTAFSAWLNNKASNILSNVLSNNTAGLGDVLNKNTTGLGKNVTSMLPKITASSVITLAYVIGGLLIAAGLITAIKGISDHKKNMKVNDERIDKLNISQEEKNKRKIEAHAKSGEKVGKKSGALAGVGAGIIAGALAGSIIPVVGTAVGATVGAIGGGLIGGIGGWLAGGALGNMIGGLKPRFEVFKHAVGDFGAKIKNNFNKSKEDGTLLKGILKALLAFNPFLMIATSFFNRFINNSGQSGFWGGVKNVGAGIAGAMVDVASYMAPSSKGKYVNMKDLGLKGRIPDENSDPRTLSKNVKNVKQLDALVSSWGYQIKYSSNMGGSHAGGPRSHASGNKLDMVVYRNGKKVQLTAAETAKLRELGYIGNGAKGYHNAGSGYHYDLHIGSGVKIDRTTPVLKALWEEEERKAREAKEAKEAKEHPNRTETTNGAKQTSNTLLKGGTQKTAATISGLQAYTNDVFGSHTNQLQTRAVN